MEQHCILENTIKIQIARTKRFSIHPIDMIANLLAHLKSSETDLLARAVIMNGVKNHPRLILDIHKPQAHQLILS